MNIQLYMYVYTVYKTKQVDNISYIWQFLYILGISLHLYYGVKYELPAIFIPTIIELFFIFVLLFLKIKYKKVN